MEGCAHVAPTSLLSASQPGPSWEGPDPVGSGRPSTRFLRSRSPERRRRASRLGNVAQGHHQPYQLYLPGDPQLGADLPEVPPDRGRATPRRDGDVAKRRAPGQRHRHLALRRRKAQDGRHPTHVDRSAACRVNHQNQRPHPARALLRRSGFHGVDMQLEPQAGARTAHPHRAAHAHPPANGNARANNLESSASSAGTKARRKPSPSDRPSFLRSSSRATSFAAATRPRRSS